MRRRQLRPADLYLARRLPIMHGLQASGQQHRQPSRKEGAQRMAGAGTVDVEILYSVSCGHLGVATWLATEFFAEGGTAVAVTLTPTTQDVLHVYVQGAKIYETHDHSAQLPTLRQVQHMRRLLRAALAAAAPMVGD